MEAIQDQNKPFQDRTDEANKLLKQKKYPEAEDLLRTLVRDQQDILGDDDPATTTSMHALGEALLALGKFEESETHFRQALNNRQRQLGKHHQSTIDSKYGLAAALSNIALYTYPEIEILVRECVDSRVHNLEPDNVDMDLLETRTFLAIAFTIMQKFDLAETEHNRVVQGYEQLLQRGGDTQATEALLVKAKDLLRKSTQAREDHERNEARFRVILEDQAQLLRQDANALLDRYKEIDRLYLHRQFCDADILFREVVRCPPLEEVSKQNKQKQEKTAAATQEWEAVYLDPRVCWDRLESVKKTRLIRLHKPDVSQTPGPKLRCSLFWALLDKMPTYTALSYTWGSGAKDHGIIIEGEEGCKEMKITKSLHDALVQILELSSESIVLWIDQICINQADNVEKTYQVRSMDRIYRSAVRTLVWLGPASDDSDDIMDFWLEVGGWANGWNMQQFLSVERIPELADIIEHSDSKDLALRDSHRTGYRQLVENRITLGLKEALTAWGKRAWFTRVWTIQEFVLAKEVVFQCGSKEVSADLLRLALLVWNQKAFPIMRAAVEVQYPGENSVYYMKASDTLTPTNSLRAFIQARNHWQRAGQNNSPHLSLFDQLKAWFIERQMKATDGRDRIYALMGMITVSTADHMDLEPDYDEANTVELTYAKATRLLIQQGAVEVLGLIQTEKAAGMPSWVPDWRSPVFRSIGSLRSAHNELFFSAASQLDNVVFPTGNDLELSLKGYRVDYIKEVGTPWLPDHFPPEAVPGSLVRLMEMVLIQDIQRFCRQSRIIRGEENSSEDDENHSEAVWRVPIGGLQDGKLSGKPYYYAEADSASYEGYLKTAKLHELLRVKYSRTGQSPELKQALSEIQQPDDLCVLYINGAEKMRYKVPFLSNTGYVGMAPWKARSGDEVFLLAGHHTPYVLRPVKLVTGGVAGRYEILGECYCDGIMRGELIQPEIRKQFVNVILV